MANYDGIMSFWRDRKKNKTYEIADAQARASIPTKVSDLQNDSGFITSTVSNLTNYYLKTDLYTKSEVNALIGAVSTIDIQVVQTLPVQDISTSTIYLVPKTTPQSDNVYDEYVNITGTSAGWELIGDTEIDLSNYYTETEVDALLSDKMDKDDPVGTGSFSMNRLSGSTVGTKSHAEGDDATASGHASHAEGYQSVASNIGSHAEGLNSTASGTAAHVEGAASSASGDSAHAEGSYASASGDNSHAEGYNTLASSDYQHVSGKYNIEDTQNTYAEIVGNGTADNARSNARELDWSGNEYLAGDLTINKGTANEMLVGQAISGKQDALTAGSNVQISGNTISATDTKPSGYDESGDATASVATGASWSILSSVAITKGKWIVSYGANFPSLGSGNTGHCGVGVSDSSTPATRPPVESCLTAQRITNDNYTTLSSSFVYDCTSNSKTLYLKVRQTSGQSLSVEGKLRVIKIL